MTRLVSFTAFLEEPRTPVVVHQCGRALAYEHPVHGWVVAPFASVSGVIVACDDEADAVGLIVDLGGAR